jgi:glucose-1-phosphate cytidylyltransferase
MSIDISLRLRMLPCAGSRKLGHCDQGGRFSLPYAAEFIQIARMAEGIDTAQVPVFILCGGLGTRLKEETEFRPKPMVPIGDHPILWHVMQCYARHGFRKFVLCLGFKADLFKDYFANFHLHNADCTIKLKTNEMIAHEHRLDLDWEVTLAHTGEKNMTGSRIAQAARKYLGNAQHFAATYGDGVTNANLREEFACHLAGGKTGTVLGVNPPSRFGEIKVDGDRVLGFDEKPDIEDHWINGGFFFFHRDFQRYLSEEPACVLERAPLVQLARDGQLNIYKHRGFWACMDTQRDREYLTKLADAGDPPWLG